jgi:hypothetical protein
MKTLFLLLLISQITVAQQNEKLFYFLNKDGMVGVKNSKGKIIIPATYGQMTLEEGALKKPIVKEMIHFWIPSDSIAGYNNTFGIYFNRNGKELVRPYSFDNGPDYLNEGLFRFVENNKIGFANRFGQKTIQAQYDFIAPFNLGTSLFCNNCYFNYKKDPEHPPLEGGTYGFINKEGKVLIDKIQKNDSSKFWDDMDSIRQQLYSSQFIYTDLEKSILLKMKPYKSQIEKKYFRLQNGEKTKESLIFNIVEKPSTNFPYYVIYAFTKSDQKISNDAVITLEFYITADGKNIYYYNTYEGKIPLLKWLKESKDK